MKFNRWKMDSIEDAIKLRDLITSLWKYRNVYIDLEGPVLIIPPRVPKPVVITLAKEIGLVCVETEAPTF